ncbi:hypothetical protein HY994_00100 [Candidatus Micrarchaeota archaeon]|nr:hypothetical protein [Candidatus Micrarchaeota archaeon]
MAFGPDGFRGLSVEYFLNKKVASTTTETTKSDENGQTTTKSVTERRSDPALNKIYLAILPVRTGRPIDSKTKSRDQKYEVRLGLQTAFEFNGNPNYLSFEFTRNGFDYKQFSQQIAQNAIRLAQAEPVEKNQENTNKNPPGNQPAQNPPGQSANQNQPNKNPESDSTGGAPQNGWSPQRAAMQKQLQKVNLAELQNVIAKLLESAFDPSVEGPTADQVARIAIDGPTRQAYLAAESIRELPVELATIDIEDALKAANHPDLKDVCAVSTDGSAECIFPSNGYKTDVTANLNKMLASRYVISDIKPVFSESNPYTHALVSADRIGGARQTKALPSCQEFSQLIGADTSVCNKKIATMLKEQPALFDSTMGGEMVFENGRCMTDNGNYRYGVFRFDLK